MKNSKAKIGLVSISDRASSGTYQDKGIPSLKEWLAKALLSDYEVVEKLIPDEQPLIEATLKELCDQENCDLILTTGGTGPSRRDVTPEATLAVATRTLPGFRRANACGLSCLCADRDFVPSGRRAARNRRSCRFDH